MGSGNLNFSFLYYSLIEQLNVFDSNGNLRSRQQAEECLSRALTLMKSLNHKNINNSVAKIERLLANLFHYFDTAKTIIDECKELPVSDECLKAYCIAWQWGKRS